MRRIGKFNGHVQAIARVVDKAKWDGHDATKMVLLVYPLEYESRVYHRNDAEDAEAFAEDLGDALRRDVNQLDSGAWVVS